LIISPDLELGFYFVGNLQDHAPVYENIFYDFIHHSVTVAHHGTELYEVSDE
jgi:hypothetical protein